MADYRIDYTDEALRDLRDLFEYIAVELKERSVAASLVCRIRDEIRSLSVFPNRCRKVEWEPWSSLGMRQMPVENFIVFFVTAEEEKIVHIVRIIYGGRDIPNIINT